MFLSNDTQRGSFIEQLREAREEREAERLKEIAVIKIQTGVRGWMARSYYQNTIRKQFDSHFGTEFTSSSPKLEKKLPIASEVFRDACKFLKIYRREKDAGRLEIYTRYLLNSMESEERKFSYVSCAMDKDLTLHWIQHIKEVVVLVCKELQIMKVELTNENRLISLYLHLLLTFTGTSTWRLSQQQRYEPLKPALKKLTQNILTELVAKGMYFSLQQILIKGLCRSKPALSGPAIITIITLSLRPLSIPDQQHNTVNMLATYLLSVPALIHHISVEAHNGLEIILKNKIFEKVLNHIYDEQNLKIIYDALEGCYALCLLANIIHLASLQHDILQPSLYHPKFSTVVFRILGKCGEYVVTNQSSLTQWHPLLGWFSQSLDHHLNESVHLLRSQLQLLWAEPILKIMFQPLRTLINRASETPRKESFQETAPPGRTKTFFKKTFESGFSSVMGFSKESFVNGSKHSRSPFSFDDPEVVKLFGICSMYYMAMTVLSQLKMDILTGLCHKNDILSGLWIVLSSFGFHNSLKSFLHHITVRPNASPQIHFLVLFCEGSIRLISITDRSRVAEWTSKLKTFNYLLKGTPVVEETTQCRKCRGSGCQKSLDTIHRRYVSRHHCRRCQITATLNLLTDQKGQFVTKMYNLISVWRKINGQEEVVDMRERCVQRNYKIPLLSDKELAEALRKRSLTVTVLDDLEMYEQQQPFSLQDYRDMSLFLNNLTYKMIKNRHVNLDDLSGSLLFHSAHTLLKLLYKRNSRRTFVPDSHWYISEVNGSSLMVDMEKGKKVAEVLIQTIPHILPHHDRVLLFRNFVKADKSCVIQLDVLDTLIPSALIPSTLITVRRGAIVEDGYRQLASLSPNALKGVIRVRFVNQQGLDEAGIDQDGVFKEFLEETLKRIFDPSLNLFRLTSEERLFPSPISSLTENHLHLFEFTGKMLAKAVYEGILVDFPFALFFLSQVIGEQQTALYSFIDELPSLDPELYKSLTYVKHYEGDVADLGLTFSHDEDYLGEVINHELRPGGKGISVTNENRISYIHLMAHFKLHTQIKDQTRAFVKGFQTIINKSWMTIFSAPEFQRLISGDNVALNIHDLRQHTHYYGGFHDKHRVVCWLWDILQNDFTEEERGLFLKFVTSCSKPPLLGFANLEPPFSIRCVEVNDDEDTGDTVGSVIRGFFAIRKDPVNRLPTSSTCFNLLKLPNYQKKSNLKEKLRYAIHSNTGFELS